MSFTLSDFSSRNRPVIPTARGRITPRHSCCTNGNSHSLARPDIPPSRSRRGSAALDPFSVASGVCYSKELEVLTGPVNPVDYFRRRTKAARR